MRISGILSLVLMAGLLLPPAGFSQDYYPLQRGNSWFYRYVWTQDSTVTSSVRVLGDSLFANGRRYSILDQDDIIGQRFVRADSTGVYYFAGEDHQVFKLNGQIGDTTWLPGIAGPYVYAWLSRIDTLMVFGLSERVLTYEFEGTLYAVMKLSQRFGPIIEWRYSDPPPPWPDYGRELVGCTIDGLRYGNTLAVTEKDEFPQSFALYQNYPNPFNPETHVAHTLRARGQVIIRVFDLLGREIRTLVDEIQQAGTHTTAWDGRDNHGRVVGSGVYLYQLRAAGFVQTRKMILLK